MRLLKSNCRGRSFIRHFCLNSLRRWQSGSLTSLLTGDATPSWSTITTGTNRSDYRLPMVEEQPGDTNENIGFHARPWNKRLAGREISTEQHIVADDHSHAAEKPRAFSRPFSP